MPVAKRSGALPTIFSFFLGLIVTAFIGVGVYTFHPSPERDFARQLAIQTGLNALLAPLVIAWVSRVSGWLAPDDDGYRRGLAVELRSRGL